MKRNHPHPRAHGAPKGRDRLEVQLIVACILLRGVFDLTLSESDDEETSPNKAYEGRLPLGGGGRFPSPEGSPKRALRSKGSSNEWVRDHLGRQRQRRALAVLRAAMPQYLPEASPKTGEAPPIHSRQARPRNTPEIKNSSERSRDQKQG